MATLKAIQDKIAKLQAQAEAIAKKESSAVFGRILNLMEKHGLTPDDIAAHFRNPVVSQKSAAATKSATPGVAKYIYPKTGATWSGYGRAPGWIANAKNRDKFLASVDSKPATVAEKTPKADHYRRGPQAPKYRDPMSGRTWSGRGPAPAWLATVKDRTQFLIDKPAASSAKSESAPAQKATKTAAVKRAPKKTATEPAAVKKAPSTKSAKKIASTTKKTAVKKAGVKRVSTKQIAAQKPSAVEALAPSIESNVSSVESPA